MVHPLVFDLVKNFLPKIAMIAYLFLHFLIFSSLYYKCWYEVSVMANGSTVLD